MTQTAEESERIALTRMRRPSYGHTFPRNRRDYMQVGIRIWVNKAPAEGDLDLRWTCESCFAGCTAKRTWSEVFASARRHYQTSGHRFVFARASDRLDPADYPDEFENLGDEGEE